jgi:surfeit locus 1 family protein
MRSTAKLTLAFLPAFAALIALGVWQIERLHWKESLIAEVNANMAAPPITLARALAMGAGAQYRRVTLDGHFDNAKEAYAFATADQGAPVYHVLTPFVLADGRALIVDRGAIPPRLLDPKTRAAGEREGQTQIIGVWRTPDMPGLFTPAPDLARHIWYARDVSAIAKADGVTLAAPIIIEADATPNPGFWPKGGQTVVNFPNNHLQYALTWFGLAAALLGVLVAYVLSGRGQNKFPPPP